MFQTEDWPTTNRYGSLNADEPLLRSTASNQSLHDSIRSTSPPASLVREAENVTLAWENLNVSLKKRRRLFGRKIGEPKDILRNVSGIVRSGTLMAIMGSSGSGKTTLLNVLTNRNLSDDFVLSGSVKINGLSLGNKVSNISAYVQQEDLFVGVLTVREHLWFQAMLRMDQSVDNEERERRIAEVISDLGLQKCEHTKIGIPGRVKAISGGERKRLAFASEVLTNPRIMFCDEPTSGLDSFMAENVIQTLKNLANRGKAILCTIHQPSSETFALFDNLMLLAEGRLIYQGSADGAKDFFASAGYPCPANYNPADFYVRTLAVVPGQVRESRIRLKKLALAFRTTDAGRQLVSEINEANENPPVLNETFDKALYKEPLVKANIFRQFRCVGWRSVVSNYRDDMFVRIRLLQNLFIALFTGLVFLGQQNDQKSIQNINGCLFLICTNMTFSNAFGVILSFTGDMPLFKRENQNGTFRTSVYYICKSLADLPLFIINPLIFTTIVYWMVGMKFDYINFLICCACAVLLCNAVVSYGYLISAACGESNRATVLAGPLLMPFILFGGFLLNNASIPIYFVWLEYLSWFKYANEIFVVNQWHNFGEIGCEYLRPNGSSILPPNHNNGSIAPPSVPPCVKTGEDVIAQMNFNYDNLVFDFIVLSILLVAFRILGLFLLLIRANPIKFRRERTPHDPPNPPNLLEPNMSVILPI